ncbi:MAG TPA: hypothetical protein VF082_02985 [Jiangellaceae bacterium]
MPGYTVLDDTAVEAVLCGGAVAPELEPLASFVGTIRTTATRPVRPSRELADRMASGAFVTGRTRRTRVRRSSPKVVAMSLRAKVAIGSVAALTGLTGVTAAGALPDAAQQRVETMIEFVTPIEFVDRAEFGHEVADDAQDGGVDGQEISERAREQAQQSTDLGNQGRADEHRSDGRPSDLPTPATVPDQPGPDDHPGTGSGGPPDVLPDGAEGRASVPPIPD